MVVRHLLDHHKDVFSLLLGHRAFNQHGQRLFIGVDVQRQPKRRT